MRSQPKKSYGIRVKNGKFIGNDGSNAQSNRGAEQNN